MTKKAKPVRLMESTATGQSAVDRNARIIRNVKVVGIQSNNTGTMIGENSSEPYSYSIAALQAALPLYEGAPVNIDHPNFRYDVDGQRHAIEEKRRTGDRFGRLVRCRVQPTGLFADLEYLASHPLAEMICECAERMPSVLAMSHEAYGFPVAQSDGRLVIERISQVGCVVVTAEKPGTTTSLFESAGDVIDPVECVRAGFTSAILAIVRDAQPDELESLKPTIFELIEKMYAACESLTPDLDEDEEAAPADDMFSGMIAESARVNWLHDRRNASDTALKQFADRLHGRRDGRKLAKELNGRRDAKKFAGQLHDRPSGTAVKRFSDSIQ